MADYPTASCVFSLPAFARLNCSHRRIDNIISLLKHLAIGHMRVKIRKCDPLPSGHMVADFRRRDCAPAQRAECAKDFLMRLRQDAQIAHPHARRRRITKLCPPDLLVIKSQLVSPAAEFNRDNRRVNIHYLHKILLLSACGVMPPRSRIKSSGKASRCRLKGLDRRQTRRESGQIRHRRKKRLRRLGFVGLERRVADDLNRPHVRTVADAHAIGDARARVLQRRDRVADGVVLLGGGRHLALGKLTLQNPAHDHRAVVARLAHANRTLGLCLVAQNLNALVHHVAEHCRALFGNHPRIADLGGHAGQHLALADHPVAGSLFPLGVDRRQTDLRAFTGQKGRVICRRGRAGALACHQRDVCVRYAGIQAERLQRGQIGVKSRFCHLFFVLLYISRVVTQLEHQPHMLCVDGLLRAILRVSQLAAKEQRRRSVQFGRAVRHHVVDASSAQALHGRLHVVHGLQVKLAALIHATQIAAHALLTAQIGVNQRPRVHASRLPCQAACTSTMRSSSGCSIWMS
nr:MAG TPA: hypothetical protein [Caudoviricetes sp.]